jgi:hypothetical protein
MRFGACWEFLLLGVLDNFRNYWALSCKYKDKRRTNQVVFIGKSETPVIGIYLEMVG